MPILPSDIAYRLSGGAANTDPDLSLGGARSTVGGGVIVSDVFGNLWDDVSGDEAVAGDTEYRAIYVENNHGTLTLTAPKLWVETPTPSPDTEIAVALAGEGLNATMEVVANEQTAPSGEVFSTPLDKVSGLSLPNLPPGSFHGLWLRRTVLPGAGAINETPKIRVEGDSLP